MSISRKMTTLANPKTSIPVYIHSTFRDIQGDVVKPYGLQWGVNGTSHVLFVPDQQYKSKDNDNNNNNNKYKKTDIDLQSKPGLARGIVEAYNRWCCAKDIPYFVTTDDIVSMEWVTSGNSNNNNNNSSSRTHIRVQWNGEQSTRRRPTSIVPTRSTKALIDLLEQDEAAATGSTLGDGQETTSETEAANVSPPLSPAEVWINGEYICDLDGTKTKLDQVKDALDQLPSLSEKKNWKRHYSNKDNNNNNNNVNTNMIRMERFYRGGIRQRPEVFDHIWDNLVALEDVEILDDQTLIGTATLTDWIMGGKLTSRLWIRDNGDSILFLRPLRNDELDSSDRRYELKANTGDLKIDKKIAMIRKELQRLKYLANLDHPYVAPGDLEEESITPHMSRMTKIRSSLRRNRNKGKFFAV